MNLVLLTCHDLGQHLGCYGIPTVRTPRIDQLAAEGVRFARSFCAAPQCSPSRAAMMTGRYPHSNGVMGLCHGLFQWDLNPEEVHLAQRLAKADYYCALVGVQHETPFPQRMGYHHCDPNSKPAVEVVQRAVQLLPTLAAQRRPFYLQIGFFEPHRAPREPSGFPPVSPDGQSHATVPPYLVDDANAREDMLTYERVIHQVDIAVGTLLDQLREHGLLDNTLFVFTSDHGIPFPRAKCSVYDPGLQVPLILHWPGGPIGRGVVHDAMISNVDYLATFLELLGLDVPANHQGHSFAPLLRGQAFTPRREVFGEMTYHDYYDPVRCIRTESHKLIVAFMYNRGFMDPSQQWRPRTITVQPPDPALSRHDVVELYDLRTDPWEQVNLSRQPGQQPQLRELLGRLHDWMRDTHDPLLEGVPMSPMHRMALASLERGDVVDSWTLSGVLQSNE